ncbi:MAG: peroxiredoxin [Xanthomonadaceae bacterium]|nr:peroxiredoxin [Xanthomonadaceae bacterium]
MLDIGDRVPDLDLPLSTGETARLADYRDRWLVLYFYPKDNTPGCTREGIDFRDLHAAFAQAGAAVLGVSRDSLKTHQNFARKHEFPFALVGDGDESVCHAFAVIKEKTLYGHKHLGIERSTFLIALDGRLARCWRGVKVPGHAQAVLDALLEARTPTR